MLLGYFNANLVFRIMLPEKFSDLVAQHEAYYGDRRSGAYRSFGPEMFPPNKPKRVRGKQSTFVIDVKNGSFYIHTKNR